MDINSNNEHNRYAVDIAWKEFETRHPRESWPEWFTKCVRISGTISNNNNWIIKITLLPKIQLKPNQHWEEKNGIPVIVEVEPLTGKRRIVICGGPAVDVEVLFEAEVDTDNGSATVITDTDISLLDGTKYEPNNY